MTNDPKREAEILEQRLQSAVLTAVARRDKVASLSSLWRDVREANNFRKSLEELFSGD